VRALAQGRTPSARVTGPVFIDDGPEEVAAVLRSEGEGTAIYVRLARACFRVDLEGEELRWDGPVAVRCGPDADGLGLLRGAGAEALSPRVIPLGLAPPLRGRFGIRTAGSRSTP
jgi:hypothetical protein